jgi:hypothetical protein
MVALILADALLEKFGGDSLTELQAALARHADYSEMQFQQFMQSRVS